MDLDVFSRTSLTPLAVAFGDRVLAMHVGRHANHFRGHFELHAPPRTGANALIAGLVRLVRELPPSARSVWKRAYRRDLNIGIQTGIAPPRYELFLEADTLRLASMVDARIAVTVYAVAAPKTRRRSARTAIRGSDG